MRLRGRVWKYGDNVDTDVIIPARYLNTSDPGELAKHAMEDLDPSFAASVMPGDLIVAGRNFGCGSSRQHAPMALKAAGVSAVLAVSFARIFFRNAVNIGLPVVEVESIQEEVEQGDVLELDLLSGTVANERTGKVLSFVPLPPFLLEIVELGGLAEYVRRRVLG